MALRVLLVFGIISIFIERFDAANTLFDPHKMIKGKFFLIEAEQNILPKVQCFRVELPVEEEQYNEKESLEYFDVFLKEHMDKREKEDNEKISYRQLIPSCPQCNCTDFLFSHKFPDNMHKNELDAWDAYLLLAQKIFLVNYPHSCDKCYRIMMLFIVMLPHSVIEIENADPNFQTKIYCFPIPRTETFHLSADEDEQLGDLVDETMEKLIGSTVDDDEDINTEW